MLSTKPGDPLPATLDVKVTLSGRYSWQAGENADAPGLPWNQDLSLAVDAAGRASVAVELPAEDSQCCFPANGVSGNDEADSCCQLSLSAYASGWAGGDVATWEEANVQAGGSVSASRATSPSGHYMRAAQLPTLPCALVPQPFPLDHLVPVQMYEVCSNHPRSDSPLQASLWFLLNDSREV